MKVNITPKYFNHIKAYICKLQELPIIVRVKWIRFQKMINLGNGKGSDKHFTLFTK
jgi:hypothetical protein